MSDMETDEWTPSTEQVRSHYVFDQTDRWQVGRSEAFDRWLAAHDAEVRAAEQERIIQDMRERSHPDDWGVPCVYVKSYAERLRGEKR